jgi:hypothetical protein
MAKLMFVVRGHRERIPNQPRPIFALTTDNWDDFGHVIQFHLSYIDKDNAETRIGAVKILRRTSPVSTPIQVATRTEIPQSFDSLDDSFISLGQEDNYYKQLGELFGDNGQEILVALRDIAWQPALSADFEPTPAFRNALMRENGARRARRFGQAWVQGQIVFEKFSFSYSCTIEGADAPTQLDVDFNGKDPLPGRVFGIIGRNAVGKTRFLANLGADLSQIAEVSATSAAKRESRFPGGRPLFTRIIAISYGAFDRFKRPRKETTSSYVYCGIRNDRGNLSQSSLIEAYRKNQQRIRERGIESEWTDYVQRILGDSSESMTASLEKEIADPADNDQGLSLLSSGQSILCHFVTSLLAWIQPNSLVLFDEPETHLHPNAVANLFLVLAEILEAHDSYSLVATHSPVVIQQMPAKRVAVFQRLGNVTTAEPLGLESFGESVAELTRHVFETIEVDDLYRLTLKRLSYEETLEEILGRFERGLSLSAQAYLLAQFGRKA